MLSGFHRERTPTSGEVVGAPAEVKAGFASAAENSAAVAKRSAGSFSSAIRTANSTVSGTRSRTRRGGAGFSVSTLATMAWAVLPMKGGSPVSIS